MTFIIQKIGLWFKRLPCWLLGHAPIMVYGKFGCERCNQTMDYRNGCWEVK